MTVKTPPLSQITVETAAEAEEAVAEMLARVTGQGVASWTNVETRLSLITAYFEQTAAALAAVKAAVERELPGIADCGLDIGPAKVSLGKVRREDWAESWKRHFKTLRVGRRLMIKPSWSKDKPIKGQALVVLDPGLSFGTGQHPTTSFCLRQLVAARDRSARPSMLDAGCGSGILAIAAAKLGYSPVDAFDFDPVCVAVTAENARRNRVGEAIKVQHKDLTRMPGRGRTRYDVICANLISTLLIAHRAILVSRLAPNGTLVLAGILATEFHLVEAAFESEGFKLLATRTGGEWQSGAFIRAQP